MLVPAILANVADAQTATPSPAMSALEKAGAAEPNEAVLTYFLSVMRGQFARKLPRVVTGRVVATLSDDTYLIPEGVAYDGTRDTLYVGSIARRTVYRLGAGARLEALSRPSDELDFVLGIAVDERAHKLYAVSTSALTDAGRTHPRNAVVVYDLSTQRRERSYPVPDAVQLNDVAIGEGFVLATDSAGGGVFRIALADGKVDALVPLGRAPGANGIAIAGDGRAYVGASRRPLRINVSTGEVTPLRFPPREQPYVVRFGADGKIAQPETVRPAQVLWIPWPTSR